MEQKNPVLIYNSLEKEITNYIQKLDELNINTESIKDKVNDINNRLEKEQNNSSLTTNTYEKYIKELENVKGELETSYGLYFKLAEMATSLNLVLESRDQLDLEEAIGIVKELLNLITVIPITDREEGKTISTIVYQLVYSFMKLESVYSKNNVLLNAVKQNPTHIPYIVEFK